MKKTDNELIAEFMGIEVVPYNHELMGDVMAIVPKEGILDYPLNIFNPQEDWNWLMSVVEKINKVCENTGYPDDTIIQYLHVISSSISDVYEAVIQFIKWYNSQTPKA